MDKQLYAVHLKFNGPVHFGTKKLDYGQSESQLHSDTLYSAVFQAWALIGRTDWIPKSEQDEITFTLSSAFPFFYNGEQYLHFFPKPYASLFKRETDNTIFVEKRKAIKKIAFLEKEEFFTWCKQGELTITEDKLKGAYYSVHLPKGISLYRSELMPRVAVARTQGEDSKPFGIDRLYFYENKASHSGLFFLFYGDNEQLKRVETALTILEDEGFGTDRKVGHGQFSFSIQPFEIPNWKGNGMINLSLFLPENKEWLAQHLPIGSTNGYHLIERGGWITTNPLNTYRKNTLHFFGEGSTFQVKDNFSLVAGAFKDVYPESSLDSSIIEKPHPVWRVGKSLLFPINTL